ncbi:hypothetical protein Tsubulata_038486 [Turnera subulata]|uniref:Peptidase A1 domain-containing protein n=1 Tax=Turnera subulata TaxID=218843 RepID=A0A9Q0G1T8_9ROSI|nr:hypothetical protein Tsubulata_038486 [Turnera subulata]
MLFILIIQFPTFPSIFSVLDNKASLKVIHKHGPCTTTNHHHNQNTPTASDILIQDQARVKSIRARLSNTLAGANNNVLAADSSTLPAKDGSTVGSGNYIVTVGLGTPKKDLSLIFDTGSDLTWTQCEPCVRYCYQQKEPKFNPSQSTSYTNISCSSSLCNSLTSATGNTPGCASSTCVYGIQYGDSSYSVGYFGTEKLSLTSTDAFDDFYFGCGQNNRGLFGGAAGLLGLGRDKLSLVSQTAQKYGKVFSYCLPSTASSTGFLTFGSSSSEAKFTPLATIPAGASFYGIDFTGISVRGQKLNIAGSVFTTAGAIIDSGTVCLAFAGNSDASDVAIFGNVQQKTFEVVYDGSAGKISYAAEENKATLKDLYSHTFTAKSLLSSNVCNKSTESRKGTLEVVHKYGPCNGEQNGAKATIDAPSLIEVLRQDQSRVDSIHARLSTDSRVYKELQDSSIPLQSGVVVGAGDYVVTVGLGTPKKDFTLIFDTGSGITWVQCEPCVKEPKFDPSKSTSYKNVSCSSPSCSLISKEGGARGCSSSSCLYQVQYGDSSYSVGFFASETLTISTSDVFKNFLFGCGQKNAGLFGQSSGLIGLARSSLSVASQTANKYRKFFSYCVPSSSSYTGYLKFGGAVSKTVKFTPLSKQLQDTPFYGLDIIGITVGGKKLAVDESDFAEGGTLIDSGTVISRLPSTAYSELSSAFQEGMKDYTLTDGYSIFDTCYDFSGLDTVVIPKISLFFQDGVELEVCLAFAGNEDDGDVAIIGNLQQRTYQVVHDGIRGRNKD